MYPDSIIMNNNIMLQKSFSFCFNNGNLWWVFRKNIVAVKKPPNTEIWSYQSIISRKTTQNGDLVISTKYSQIFNTNQISGHIHQVLSDIQHKTEIWSFPPSTHRRTTQNRDLVISTRYSQIFNTKQRSGHIYQLLSGIQHKTQIWFIFITLKNLLNYNLVNSFWSILQIY